MSKKVKVAIIVACSLMFIFSSVLLFVGAKKEAQADNKNKENHLEIRVTDSSGNPINGVAYELYQGDTFMDIIVSNEAGVATSRKLPIGNYTYKMVQCNNYYRFDKALYQVTLDEPKIVEIHLPRAGYEISLNVTDELGNPINGLEYNLYKEGELICNMRTKNNQMPSVSGLFPGGYTIKLVSGPEWLELNYDYVVSLCGEDICCNITYDSKGKNTPSSE